MKLSRQSLNYFHNIGATHYSTEFTEAGHPMAYKIKDTHMAAFKNGGWYTIDKLPENISPTLLPIPDDLILPSPYHREIHGVVIDVYDIMDAYKSEYSAIDHMKKKAIIPGGRGHKNLIKDLEEVIWSAQRAIEMIKEKTNDNSVS